MSEFSRELLLARFMAKAVFFAGILFSKCQLIISEEHETAATDGETIWINPKFMGTLALDEQVFVLCHEVFHVMFFHCAQLREWLAAGFLPDGQPMDGDRHNQACDYVINHLLVEMGFKMPACGLIDPNKYPHTLGSLEVYKKLRTQQGGGGQGGNKPGFDKHIPSPKPATEGQKQQMAAAVAASAQAAKKAGQLPAALAGLVGELINPTTPWQEVLRQRIVHSRKTENTWSRPNRRRLAVNPVVMPARRGTSCGDIAAIMDTSGSIGRQEAGAFLSELKFICEEAHPDKVWILWTDTQVAHADELDDPAEIDGVIERIMKKGVPGGGGTDMPAGFHWLEKNQVVPTTCVVFTDGETPWGQEQQYPVIWAITNKGIRAPHGDTVHITLEK